MNLRIGSGSPAAQRGFNLIEVLVALFVLAIGVLGAAALQVNSLKFNQTASMRSQATILAYDIVDRMRANRNAAFAGNYSIGMDDEKPTGTEIHQEDLSAWLSAIEIQLPAGDGSVVRDGNRFIITVQWDESRIGGESEQQFAFAMEL